MGYRFLGWLASSLLIDNNKRKELDKAKIQRLGSTPLEFSAVNYFKWGKKGERINPRFQNS